MGCLKGEYPKSGVRIGVYVFFVLYCGLMNLNVIFFQGMFLLHLNIDLESAAFFWVGLANMLRMLRDITFKKVVH